MLLVTPADGKNHRAGKAGSDSSTPGTATKAMLFDPPFRGVVSPGLAQGLLALKLCPFGLSTERKDFQRPSVTEAEQRLLSHGYLLGRFCSGIHTSVWD